MNYMRELNAFRDWSLLNSPSTGEIALWHSLMSVNNAAGWVDWFTAANQTLQLMTGLSRQGLDKTRNRLVQRGLIEYRKGVSNQAGKYHIVSFECQKVGTAVDTTVVTSVAFQESHQLRFGSHNGGTLKDLDKDETNTNQIVIARALKDGFEQNFGRLPNEVQLQRFVYFVDKGLEPNLVIRAMSIARTNGASVPYALKILERLLDRGITTVAQAEIAEAERQASVTNQPTRRRGQQRQAETRDERYATFYQLFPDA